MKIMARKITKCAETSNYSINSLIWLTNCDNWVRAILKGTDEAPYHLGIGSQHDTRKVWPLDLCEAKMPRTNPEDGKKNTAFTLFLLCLTDFTEEFNLHDNKAWSTILQVFPIYAYLQRTKATRTQWQVYICPCKPDYNQLEHRTNNSFENFFLRMIQGSCS